MRGLTSIPGIRVGHASNFDALTGCTAILCETGAVGGVDIRGSASETSSIDTLQPGHVTSHVHGIVLSGGSAFGLETVSGVRHYLEQRGAGFRVGQAVVPIVPGAVVFDLGIGKAGIHPTREMGESAAASATADPVKEGAVGAGTGATVGKLFGMRQAMKSGIGSGLVELPGGLLVAALVVVNAFGDVRDPASGALIAGARRAADSMDLADTESVMKAGGARAASEGRNSTLAVVATNARLTKVEAAKLAEFGGLGVARTIYPVWTMFDGDTTFALSIGDARADVNTLGVAAAEAVAQAVVRAVRNAPSMGGVPGLAA
ncbi:MAG TPA: P1 family peptidase [Bryobacteraceae bacterium]|jgi:L-aminopeptidase/D-esterase-like protein|nr:P1 family peptidase [Bryobacteraceae bacterium]